MVSALEELPSIDSVILGRYQWQLADTLCPSKDVKSVMGTVSAVPGPLLQVSECSFVMEGVAQFREYHGQWGC